MAIIEPQNQNIKIHHIPQSSYVDAVRWLPSNSALHKHAILSLFDPNSSSSSLQLHSFDPLSSTHPSILSPLSSQPFPSRASSLRTTPTLVAFSTFCGSLHVLPRFGIDESGIEWGSSVSVRETGFHVGPVTGMDVGEGVEGEVVSVGEDGRVNLSNVGDGKVFYRRVFDGEGLVCYDSVKWASPMEFVTGGLGWAVHWWDHRRKAGAPVLHFKPAWPHRGTPGIVHSIDIHPSRKHTCVVGGSSGTVFAWDLRWPQQPIILSGVGISERSVPSVSESEVWEVQFDCHMQSSNIGSTSSSKILPVMMCSEEGMLAVLEPGAEPTELLEEHCAINCFDIDKQNNSDILCGLEWESVAVLLRS